MLFVWHINNNIIENYRKWFDTQKDFNAFKKN